MRALKIAGALFLGGLGLLKLGALIIVLVQGDDRILTLWFLKHAVYCAAFLSVAHRLWSSARSAAESQASPQESFTSAASADPDGHK